MSAAAGSTPAGSGSAPAWTAVRARESEWQAYLGRIATGEQQALAALYDDSCSLVYGLALRILGNSADAEEVALDVYNHVWRNAREYDAERGGAASWLAMLTRSRAIDRARARAARSGREEPIEPAAQVADSALRPDQAGAASQQAALVRAALDSLPAEQREAVELAFFGGLTHSELAERLGQPLGTIKTRIRRGMLKLRELLAPLANGAGGA